MNQVAKGAIFRAMDGPTYKGESVGVTGLYRAIDFEQHGDRHYIVAYPVNQHGLQMGGLTLLYVQGEPYPLPELPEWICAPYRVVPKTKLVQEDVVVTRNNGVKRVASAVSGESAAPTQSTAGGARNVVAKVQRKRSGMSMVDAAAEVLAREGKPLHAKVMVERMKSLGLYTPSGATPDVALTSGIRQELKKRGDAARFVYVSPCTFGLRGAK